MNEEYIYDAKGRLENAGFLDYRCPVASDLPMIEPILVEVPNSAHPYGAKGVARCVLPTDGRDRQCDPERDRRADELPADVAPAVAGRDRRRLNAWHAWFSPRASVSATPVA